MEVYKAVRKARPGFRSAPFYLGPALSSDNAFSVLEHQRYDKLLEAERDLRAALSALEREGDFVRTEAARVAQPEGLWWVAGAFGFLTVVGVVVPVAGLSWRPVPSDLFARKVMVGLFMSGLAVLGVYLVWAVRRLSKR